MHIEKVVGSTFALGSNPITLESFEDVPGHEKIVENYGTKNIHDNKPQLWLRTGRFIDM